MVLLLACPALAADADSPILPARDLTELQERLSGILKEANTPGMGVVIANRDGIVWSAGIGLADVAAGKPATSTTLFRIASVSKTFVALAVLKLVEEGKLSLDAPVKGLVPEVAFANPWEATDPVRVAHLLEHTTGWDDIHPKEFAHSDPKPMTLAQGLAIGPESRTSRWRPGTRFSYSNAGPAVAAAIVEKLTGKRFEDYVKETFFDPLGMSTADYFYSQTSF
jgi:CubicO group peptidase (beta-lactamase class C family)